VSVSAEVEVTRPVHDPSVGVELALPVLFPDMPVASTVDPVPGLGEPGRYHLSAVGRPLGGENARLRLTLSLVDSSRHRVCDMVRADSNFVREGVEGTTPSPVGGMLMLSTTWEAESIERPEPRHPMATRPLRRSGQPAAISVIDVTKRYLPPRRGARLREALPRRMTTDVPGSTVALDGVSLTVERGEAVGLIGPNGAGKTTLLKAVAGIIAVDSGAVSTSGVVVPMMDLGGALDAPLKQYSSGMRARLGFSIALHAPGDILLIDELLAVGDEEFRRAAITAVEARRRAGATILFVSHELQMVEQVCDRVVRLQHGALVEDGSAADVVRNYAGTSWAGGVRDATAGVRLLPFRLERRHIPTGGTLEFEGEVIVDEPSPTAHLELAYRAVPEDRRATMTLEDRLAMSVYLRTVEPSGGILSRPGRYRYRCVVEGNQFGGEVDVVLSVLDERENVILGEVWEEILVGHRRPEGFPGPVLDFEWSVERVTAVADGDD
jgi:ABC-2 type transport system ATP-binding protein/lipopolysaccharide transport system ATP-binding protein